MCKISSSDQWRSIIAYLCTLNGLKQTLLRRATVLSVMASLGTKNIQYKIEERCNFFPQNAPETAAPALLMKVRGINGSGKVGKEGEMTKKGWKKREKGGEGGKLCPT